MKKILIVFIVLFVGLGTALGGSYLYFRNSKSPAAVASRTMANLRAVESVSMDMQVDTDVKAEIGLLQFFGVGDPETTINMNYDIDMYRNPSLLHANVSISAFDIDALKGIETLVREENGRNVQYFRWNDKWYRYVSGEEVHELPDDSISDESSMEDEDEQTFFDRSFDDLPEMEDGGTFKVSYGSGHDIGKKEAFSAVFDTEESIPDTKSVPDEDNPTPEAHEVTEEAANAVDFNTILKGIKEGELDVSMREETEDVDGKECFVYDIDLTGDMLEKVIRLSSGEKSLIPRLKADEHVIGQLYIDSKECLPKALILSTGEILSEQMKFEKIGTSFAVTKVDININVTGYNTGKTAEVPEVYTDISDLEDLGAQDWLGLALDLTGLGNLMNGNVEAQ